MPQHRIITTSADATQTLAEQIASHLSPGSVLRLDGPLGAGKTCFVQGLARGLGVPRAVRVHSPTFTLLNIYPGRLSLYHFDWYRLSDARELEGLDLDEYFDGDGISVVEWGERFPHAFPLRTSHICLTIRDAITREITLPDSFRLTHNS